MNFDEMNETDVREAVIAPLIRELGYAADSRHRVKCEVPLAYPKLSLGRRDERKDPILRGRADYKLSADDLVNWIIEAKPPTSPITEQDLAQAWSYAIHSEVRAVYFAICNGRELIVLQSNRGPKVPPLLTLSYEELMLPEKRQILKNLLSPEAILRDHATLVIDTGLPLGPGLRSFASVTGGFIRYTKATPDNPALRQIQMNVIGGMIERGIDKGLLLRLENRAPIVTVDEFLKRNGLTKIELVSEDTFVSTDSAKPTEFTCRMSTVFPAGAILHDIERWEDVALVSDLRIMVEFHAWGLLRENILRGTVKLISAINGEKAAEAEGVFEISLS